MPVAQIVMYSGSASLSDASFAPSALSVQPAPSPAIGSAAQGRESAARQSVAARMRVMAKLLRWPAIEARRPALSSAWLPAGAYPARSHAMLRCHRNGAAHDLPIARSVVLALLLAAAGAAHADGMAIFIKNHHDRDIALELHGPGDRLWPGDDQVYLIEKNMQKSIPIECEAGERICYGAWLYGDDRTNFGVGPDNTKTCDNCCTTCVAKSTYKIDLWP